MKDTCDKQIELLAGELVHHNQCPFRSDHHVVIDATDCSFCLQYYEKVKACWIEWSKREAEKV